MIRSRALVGDPSLAITVQRQIQIAIPHARRQLTLYQARAIKVLDRPFFRSHFQLADCYARWITRPGCCLSSGRFASLAPRRDDRVESKTDTHRLTQR